MSGRPEKRQAKRPAGRQPGQPPGTQPEKQPQKPEKPEKPEKRMNTGGTSDGGRPPGYRVPPFLGYPVLALLGVLVAGAGSLVQSGWFPLGLLLALAGALALFWGGALATGTKLGAVIPAAAWAVTVMALSTTRPQGDFLFAAGAGSYLFLFGGMAAAGLCAALAPSDRPMFDVTAPRGPAAPAGPQAGRN